LPTYETKDVGLIFQKQEDYNFDRSIVITDNGQMQYMQVVLKSIEQFEPKLANSTIHLTHGVVKLAGGIKMSSREGNFAKATDVLTLTKEALVKSGRHVDEKVILGAVKYEFLKTHIAGDIIYDPSESVSLEGNSGPYIQYALVRAKSILAKAQTSNLKPKTSNLEPDERSLARKISMYPEVFGEASKELAPNHICTYLYELCQLFNRFYEKNRVIDDPRSNIRLSLVKAYSAALQSGLKALSMPIVEKM
jgi:arginyl-tRNA synthetase